ncbi:ACT domain-containing protein [Candidatus Woesearchaeota archaeon]|nr:ACT domain-containing protein [Candidatus Woesearchaeota archaeon]
MNKSTTEITSEYIKEHADIKSCLKKRLINYSSLARLISKELNIEKKTSKEAILIAARRFQEKLKQEINYEKKIKNLLADSEIEIKNKITIFVLEKDLDFVQLREVENFIKKDSGVFYLLEGSGHYSIITQDKYAKICQAKLGRKVITRHENQALINYKSSKDIEYVPGVVAYLTSLFTEHNVNITEIISFWTDTLFIINNNDANKAMSFLKF